MTETKSFNQRDYWRDYSRCRYETKTDRIKIRNAITYYRKKRKDGEDWIPKPSTKLHIWCQLHGLDTVALIEGTQKLPSFG